MSSPYDGNPLNFPATLLIPDDLDLASAAIWAATFEGLADRTKALVRKTDTYFPSPANIAFGSWSTWTWTKPSNSLWTGFFLKGSGGGGAGGFLESGGTAGGGGGAGETTELWLPSSLVPNTLTVTIGQPGAFGFWTDSTPTGGEAGGNGENTTVSAPDFSLTARGGFGALTQPGGLGTTWPPVGTGSNIGGLGGGWADSLYTTAEVLALSRRGRAGGLTFRGACGGPGGNAADPDGKNGGDGEAAAGGLAGGTSTGGGFGGYGAGAGGGGGPSVFNNRKGGGGAGGYRWVNTDGLLVKAFDGEYLDQSIDVWRGGKGAPGIAIIHSLRGVV